MNYLSTRPISFFFSLLLVLGLSAPARADKPMSPGSLTRNESGQLVFDSVVTVPGASQGALYLRAKNWIISNVKTADNNIRFDDQDSAIIVTTPSVTMPDLPHKWRVQQFMNFKLTINFKVGRYRMTCVSFATYGKLAADRPLFGGPIETTQYSGKLELLNQSFDDGFRAFLSTLASAMLTEPEKW